MDEIDYKEQKQQLETQEDEINKIYKQNSQYLSDREAVFMHQMYEDEDNEEFIDEGKKYFQQYEESNIEKKKNELKSVQREFEEMETQYRKSKKKSEEKM